MGGCADVGEAGCRDGHGALKLQLIAIAAILVASMMGMSIPILLARFSKGRKIYSDIILLVKCFAAGVILSTGFVHVLPDAFESLGNDCLPAHPWRDFPFAGSVAMVGALVTLLVDVLATAYHSGKNHYIPIKLSETEESANKQDVEMGMVGGPCHSHSAIQADNDNQRNLGNSDDGEDYARLRQRLVSQVLEIGIIFHSVIIGVTLGMSQNKCTIRPLVGALAFHQFFEGMGLGGCVAQADFRDKVIAGMALLFSMTTPLGIATGMIVNYLSGLNKSSPTALIVEGLFGSASSGILVYMALVDLIAEEFLNTKKLKAKPALMGGAYFALFVGAGAMSLLALWA